ncbi:MAG: SMI1/KNR4 family protein, partial [Blastocatellia bacterium]
MAAYNEKLTQMKASSLGGTAPGDEALSTAVREIGHNLPGNYSELLQDWGSWYTPLGYSYFGYRQPYPGGSRGILNVFFGLLPGDEYDLLVNYRRYKERIPPNLLPIADDPGGNLICL